MLLKELRQQVLDACLSMHKDALAHGPQGNISARDPQTGLVAITPTAIPYEEMTAEDVCVIDLNCKMVEGKWKTTSETPLHMVFYRRRADVMAVVHCHAPYSSVFAIMNEPLPMALAEGAMAIGGPVPVAPYRRPGSEELADVTADTLGQGTSAFMAQHGLIAVGTDLASAYFTTLGVEMTARLVLMARSAGGHEMVLPQDEVDAVRKHYLATYKRSKA